MLLITVILLFHSLTQRQSVLGCIYVHEKKKKKKRGTHTLGYPRDIVKVQLPSHKECPIICLGLYLLVC